MTLPVIAIFVAKPGFEQKLEALFRSVVETTLREPGCISYQINRDLANPRRFVFTEEWESQADLRLPMMPRRHRTAAHRP